ncbi:MAG TPA: NADH-quinone oxidoreductase subunit C [Candidatus Deferrimicrobiaceae bacterium]
MDAKAIFQSLKSRFGDAVIELQDAGFDPAFVVVSPAAILSIARFLRDDPSMKFDALMCLSGVDYKENLAVAYHLHSMSLRHKIGVKVLLPKEEPRLDSVDSVWPTANFMEREAYDMFGIHFIGSIDLRRILLPEDWPGHPLRKDYVYPESYHGVKV